MTRDQDNKLEEFQLYVSIYLLLSVVFSFNLSIFLGRHRPKHVTTFGRRLIPLFWITCSSTHRFNPLHATDMSEHITKCDTQKHTPLP